MDGEKGHVVTEPSTEDASDAHIWTPVTEFDEFVELCGCGQQPHLNLLTDPDSFSTTQRGGRMGPVMLQDVVLGADTSIDCGDVCSTYRVFLVRSGRAAGKHRGCLPAAVPALRLCTRQRGFPRCNGTRVPKYSFSRWPVTPWRTRSAMHWVDS